MHPVDLREDHGRVTLRALLAKGELDLARPGRGSTWARFRALRSWGRADLSLGRLAEAHTDAVAILDEAGCPTTRGVVYGVWASERPGTAVTLHEADGRPELCGTKDFCSGIDLCDRALVTAHRPDDPDRPVLVEVDLRAAQRTGTIETSTARWRSPALAATHTGSVTFDRAAVAQVVGEPGWYLDRPGFWHGAIGPAAVWAGGALGLIDHALEHARHDPHVDAHLGALRAIGWEVRVLLDAAGDQIDAEPDDESGEARSRALTVRHLIERSATEVLDRFGRAMGPGPLAFDPAVAERHAGLALYIRQSHAERDLEDLEHSAADEQVRTP